MVKRLLLTPGEPAGIGPELCVRLAQKATEHELVAIASPALLEQYAKLLGLPLKLHSTNLNSSPCPNAAGELKIIPVELAESVTPGQLNSANAAYVLETLAVANDLCLSKHAHAVVTAPVQKSIINDAGHAFSGHTEFFSERSGCNKVVMMLACDTMRVALATTHLPLSQVSSAISKQSLREVLTILIDELHTKFKLDRPRVLVAGLNPHAGEGGHLGTEEIDTIQPVLESIRQHSKAELIGPLPADTLFTNRWLERADAVLAMYHDQGLPVLKYAGFGRAVNITLGLPYVRTSVDHGTALDLAGKGTADLGSLEEAVSQAVLMS